MNRCPKNNYPLSVMQVLRRCPCLEYSKEGLCDHPYKHGMSYEQCREVTERMKEAVEQDKPLFRDRDGRPRQRCGGDRYYLFR
jgi:hypothetical protein